MYEETWKLIYGMGSGLWMVSNFSFYSEEEFIMKKTLVSALTTALVVGAASTTFAAANPFSDVPAGHWAYDAVSQLAADGVIEGYGDGTYRGDRTITRYEMAQMVAKALAKHPGGVDKAMLDKLAAEFSEELNNLGVRVANLEKHSDMVQWKGELRYTYTSERFENAEGGTDKSNGDKNLLRLEPKAEVNENWDINARLDATNSMDEDSAGNVSLKRAWAQGNYHNFTAKFGRVPDLTSYDKNLMFFNQFSGVELDFGPKEFNAQIRAGRIDLADDSRYDDTMKRVGLKKLQNNDNAANFQSIALTYHPSKLSVTGAYYHFNSDAFKNEWYSRSANEDHANIWEIASTYRFDKNVALTGAYMKNTKADYFSHSHVIDLSYKGAKKSDPGSWGANLSYRYQGGNTSMDPSCDGAMQNTKGWELGAAYVPMKNIQLRAIYFRGKQLAYGDRKAEKLFGRVEFFF